MQNLVISFCVPHKGKRSIENRYIAFQFVSVMQIQTIVRRTLTQIKITVYQPGQLFIILQYNYIILLNESPDEGGDDE